MRLDDEKPVDQALHIGDAKAGHGQRQAGPVEAAHAVGEQVPRLDGLLILLCALDLFAQVLNAGRDVEQGSQFPDAALIWSASTLTASNIALATASAMPASRPAMTRQIRES